jgi:hypothetical protein
MHFLKFGLLTAGTAGLVVLGAGTAFAAAPTVPMVNNNTVGEAGYYVNDNGGTRIRDVQATTIVVNTLEDLNGSNNTVPGGAGVELCNDNTGWAAQLGLEWDSGTSSFVVEYNYTGNPSYGGTGDTLTTTSTTDPDPCAEGGLLNAGDGEHFNNTFTPKLGDTIHFEIYYDPNGKNKHELAFKEQDLTQNITRVQTVNVKAQDLFEAGVGIVSNANDLTGGAVNLLNTFTGTSFNYYSSHVAIGSILSTHWDLEMADFVNGSNQVTLSPGPLNTAGTSFTELEGSTSA